MPFWRIFAHPDTFSYEQRKGLTAAITKLYTDVGLPAFYVIVIFINAGEDQVWMGGQPKKNFVRIVIEQIARTMPGPETEAGRAHRTWWMDNINAVCFVFVGVEVDRLLTF
jgi:hypothetical protein